MRSWKGETRSRHCVNKTASPISPCIAIKDDYCHCRCHCPLLLDGAYKIKKEREKRDSMSRRLRRAWSKNGFHCTKTSFIFLLVVLSASPCIHVSMYPYSCSCSCPSMRILGPIRHIRPIDPCSCPCPCPCLSLRPSILSLN